MTEAHGIGEGVGCCDSGGNERRNVARDTIVRSLKLRGAGHGRWEWAGGIDAGSKALPRALRSQPLSFRGAWARERGISGLQMRGTANQFRPCLDPV